MNDTPQAHGIGFWVAVIIGWAIIVFGAVGYISSRGSGDAFAVARWVVGGNILHDAILVPAVLLVGALLARYVPEPWRTPIRAGLFASACLTLVAIPLLGGFGRKAANPSVLPLDYTTSVLTALGIVWAIAASWLILRAMHSQRADAVGASGHR